MERQITYYDLSGSQSYWQEIVQRFQTNISSSGVPYFDENSEVETAFVEYCGQRGVGLTRKRAVSYDGKGSTSYEFCFLRPSAVDIDASKSFKRRCDGGGNGICWNDAEQLQRIVVTAKLAKQLDKAELSVCGCPTSPKIFLITRRLRDLMLGERFTGIELKACLEEDNAGKNAAEETVAASAKYFQFRIISKVKFPARVGKQIGIQRCNGCEAANILVTETEPHFNHGELEGVDFQSYNKCLTDNSGSVPISGEVSIISTRALKCLIEGGAKGLKGAPMAGLPIKFQTVEVRSAN